MAFKKHTIQNVINPLIEQLQNIPGYVYPSQGHFLREIELLKFPFMLFDPDWDYNNGRNVYNSNQYMTIYQHLQDLGLIVVEKSDRPGNTLVVKVTGSINTKLEPVDNEATETKATETSTIDTSIAIKVRVSADTIVNLYQENPDNNLYELILTEGEELTLSEIKALNNQGFVYHSEQTGIDYETEDGPEYMDIYYFAKVKNVDKLFEDCLPF
jgi:hypothetical protein